jgi:hypothetical protein
VYFAFLDNSARVLDRRRGTLLASPALAARPAAGPTLGGTLLIVPVVTSEFVVLDLADGLKASRISLRDQLAPRLETAAVTPDGRSVAMLTVSSAGRAVSVFRRPSPQ